VACGCIVILLDWDESRRELVRHLQLLGLPLVVLVITRSKEAEAIRRAPAQEKPEQFCVLEIGQIAEGLQQLGGRLR